MAAFEAITFATDQFKRSLVKLGLRLIDYRNLCKNLICILGMCKEIKVLGSK